MEDVPEEVDIRHDRLLGKEIVSHERYTVLDVRRHLRRIRHHPWEILHDANEVLKVLRERQTCCTVRAADVDELDLSTVAFTGLELRPGTYVDQGGNDRRISLDAHRFRESGEAGGIFGYLLEHVILRVVCELKALTAA